MIHARPFQLAAKAIPKMKTAEKGKKGQRGDEILVPSPSGRAVPRLGDDENDGKSLPLRTCCCGLSSFYDGRRKSSRGIGFGVSSLDLRKRKKMGKRD